MENGGIEITRGADSIGTYNKTPVCHINATLSPALLRNYGKSRAFCRAEVDCPKLYEKVYDFAQSYFGHINADRGATSEPLKTLVAETPHIFELPTFGKKKLALKFQHGNFYELSYHRKPYVAVIGSDPSWSYGIMAALWQPAGNGLEAVAGFEFNWSRGAINSVKVDVAE